MNCKVIIGLCISLVASLGAMDAEALSLGNEDTEEVSQVEQEGAEPVVITDEDYALLEPHLDPSTVFALTLQYEELPYTFTVLDRRGYELILGALRESKAAFSGLLTRLTEAHNYDDFCRVVQAASFLGVNELMDQLYDLTSEGRLFTLFRKNREFLKALLHLQLRYPDLMICYVNYNKENLARWPLMVFALREKDGELLNLLLQAGADVNIYLPLEGSLIEHAIIERNRVGVRWLIKAGANLHPAGRDSVLKEAINRGTTLKMVKLLLERGGYAEDVLEWARVEWPGVVELLEKYKPKE